MNNFSSLAAGALWSERKRDNKYEKLQNISQPGEISHPHDFSEVSGDFFSGVDTRRNRARGQINNSLAAVTKESSHNDPHLRSRSMNLGFARLNAQNQPDNKHELKQGTSEVQDFQPNEKSIPDFLLEQAGLSSQAFVERYSFLPSSSLTTRPAKVRFIKNPLRIVRELTLEDEITAAKQLTERPVDMFMRFKKLKVQKADINKPQEPMQKVKPKPPKRSETFGATDEIKSPQNFNSGLVDGFQGSNPAETLEQQPKETWKKHQTAVEKYTVKKIMKATIDALPRLLGTLMVIPKDIPDLERTESNGRMSRGTYSVTEINNLSKARPSSEKIDAMSMRSSYLQADKRSRDRDSNSRKESRGLRQSQRSGSSTGPRREAGRGASVQAGENMGASTSSGQELQQRSGVRSRSTDATGSAARLRSRQRSLSKSAWNKDGNPRRIQEHPEFKQWKGKVDAMIGGTVDPSIRKYGNLVITDLQDTLQNFGRIDRLREMIGGVVGDKAGVNGTQTSKKMVRLNPIKPRDADQPSVNTKMNGLVGDVQEVEEILRKFLATKRTPYKLDNEESEIVRKMEEIEAVLNDRAKRERLQQADARTGDPDGSEDDGPGGYSQGRARESRDD